MRLAAAVLLFLVACAADDSRRIEREVEVLIGEPGAAADAAESALVERGPEAILFLETGLWRADARGRARIIEVLEAIGDREALPIVKLLARRDRAPEVRARAERARKKLE